MEQITDTPCIARFTGHRGPVYGLAPTGHPHRFLSASGDGKVVRWDLRSPDLGEPLADALKAVYALHFDAEKHLMFMGNEHGGLHVVDTRIGEEVRLLKAHSRGIFHIVPIGPGRIACSSGDGTLSVWSVPEMALLRQVPLSAEKARGLALSPDGAWLAAATLDGMVRILDTQDLNEHHTLPGHDRGAASVAWHPNKPVLVSGGRDGHLRFWHAAEDLRPLQAIPAHRANIYGIAFSPNGQLCATASRDKTVKLWRADTFEVVAKLDLRSGGHTHSVNAVLWCADGSLLSAGDDRIIRQWRTSRVDP